MTDIETAAIENGAQCKVESGTHAGKSGDRSGSQTQQNRPRDDHRPTSRRHQVQDARPKRFQARLARCESRVQRLDLGTSWLTN